MCVVGVDDSSLCVCRSVGGHEGCGGDSRGPGQGLCVCVCVCGGCR